MRRAALDDAALVGVDGRVLVAQPAVGDDSGAGCDRLGDEPVQRLRGAVRVRARRIRRGRPSADSSTAPTMKSLATGLRPPFRCSTGSCFERNGISVSQVSTRVCRRLRPRSTIARSTIARQSLCSPIRARVVAQTRQHTRRRHKYLIKAPIHAILPSNRRLLGECRVRRRLCFICPLRPEEIAARLRAKESYLRLRSDASESIRPG